MDSTPNEPPQPTDAKPSPVRVIDPNSAEPAKRRAESAPPEPHQPIEEPGYGHGV